MKRDGTHRIAGPALAVVASLAMLSFGCSGDDEGTDPTPTTTVAARDPDDVMAELRDDACAALPAAAAAKVADVKMVETPGSAPSECGYVDAEGEGRVIRFYPLALSGQPGAIAVFQPVGVDVLSLGDEASWNPAAAADAGRLVVRTGGVTFAIEVGLLLSPQEHQEAARRLAVGVLNRIGPVRDAPATDVGASACADFGYDILEKAVGPEPDVVTVSAAGSCQVTGPTASVVVSVAQATGAGPTALEQAQRSTTDADGERQWTRTDQDVADGAVWLADPVATEAGTGRGTLYVLVAERLLTLDATSREEPAALAAALTLAGALRP